MLGSMDPIKIGPSEREINAQLRLMESVVGRELSDEFFARLIAVDRIRLAIILQWEIERR